MLQAVIDFAPLDANAGKAAAQWTAIGLSCRRILGIRTLSLMPFRLVMADHATGSSACHGVMTR
ncbi:MAG TPA: hypothetical protein VEK55_04515, partial [Xanthobacteraceae bacterium]|nr:hypothetical protein [Xanthobacteraceae bacterium]